MAFMAEVIHVMSMESFKELKVVFLTVVLKAFAKVKVISHSLFHYVCSRSHIN